MDPQLLFALAFPLAAPFWALMILAPGWSVTRRAVDAVSYTHLTLPTN